MLALHLPSSTRAATLTLLAAAALCTAPLAAHAQSARLLDDSASSLALQLGAGAAAAAVSVPLSLMMGTWIGTLSSNLILAALPSLVIAAAVPPLAVTWAVWLAGNWGAPSTFRFQPAVWATVLVHVVALVAAGYLGVSARDLSSLALFTLAEGVLLPSASTATMRLTRPRPAPPPLGEPRAALPPAAVVPVVSLAF